jgi:hypothetical protein
VPSYNPEVSVLHYTEAITVENTKRYGQLMRDENSMNEELTTTEAAPLVQDGVATYTTPVKLHPDYTPEKAQRASAKQWSGLFGTLTFIAVMFPVLFRELPPPDVLIVSLMGVAIMATIGYQIGYIWGSPVIKRFYYAPPAKPAPPEALEAAPEPEKTVSQASPVAEVPTATSIQNEAATINDEVTAVAEIEQV